MRTTLLLLIAMTLAGCSTDRPAAVYQNGTIDSLLDGNYDGETTFGQLREHGNFGLGTFDEVDGEMIGLDGQFYQAKSDGTVVPVGDHVETPFAAVTQFDDRPAEKFEGPAEYAQLQKGLDRLRPNPGRAYAIRVEGVFPAVKVRSVERQKPPYRPLAEVVKTQAVFEFKDVEGTLVGFWFPQSMRHVNVPGYHFHFISKDRTSGGHVLGLTLRTATAAVREMSVVQIEMPRTAPTTRTAGDRHDEMEKVEKQPAGAGR